MLVIRFLIAALLFEVVVAFGVSTARYVLEFATATEYYALYHQERVERLFWQEKVRCGQKLNGCSLQETEKRLRAGAMK